MEKLNDKVIKAKFFPYSVCAYKNIINVFTLRICRDNILILYHHVCEIIYQIAPLSVAIDKRISWIFAKKTLPYMNIQNLAIDA